MKILLGRVPFHPFVGRLIDATYKGRVPDGGHAFDLHLGSQAPYPEIARLFWGYYEKSERSLIQRFLHPGANVIELGSGVGVISCSILRKIGPAGKLLCVEGNPQTISVLRNNLTCNYPARSADQIIHATVDYSNAESIRYHSDSNILGSSVVGDGPSTAGQQRAPALSLAKVYEQSGFQTFALVCDIEGAEVGILRQDAEILRRCNQIIIELHTTTSANKRYSVLDLKTDIERLGFRCIGSRRNVFTFERDVSTFLPG